MTNRQIAVMEIKKTSMLCWDISAGRTALGNARVNSVKIF